ncbi:hypothetical protein CFOL_v3_04806, partial [Cephalotus follicularis]
HDDSIVITLAVANFEVNRVLVDDDNSIDILYYNVFEKMKLGYDRLKPTDSPFYGFSGEPICMEGAIKLPVTAGTSPHQSIIMVKFLVVKLPSAYNVILGRPSLNTLGVVVSIPHLKMKFPTTSGIAEVRVDQKTSRQCYLTTLKPKYQSELSN